MKNTKISWAHHTFNPWWGCEKVSPACDFCYAEAFSKRVGKKVWGKDAPRRAASDSYWMEPFNWDYEAQRAKTRHRVFCASMADVFEARTDLDPLRERLWQTIGSTPFLDWLLLTKRPENILQMTPGHFWGPKDPIRNVWVGTTVENQRRADERLPFLARVRAAVRFVSAEPLLGPLDLTGYFPKPMYHCGACGHEFMRPEHPACGTFKNTPTSYFMGIDWVVAGGESGPHARPTNPLWVRALRDQCKEREIPFHFKQWGEWAPHGGEPVKLTSLALFNKSENGDQPILLKDLAPDRREDWSEWQTPDDIFVTRMGKKKSGRLLDGVLHDAFPEVAR